MGLFSGVASGMVSWFRSRETAEDFVGDELPAGAPEFTRHFVDPMYDDAADDLAPFGSDEGWDLLVTWGERRGELTEETTVVDIIAGEHPDDAADVVAQLDVPEENVAIPEPGGQVDAAAIVIGAGFTLLRLAGRIDDEGRVLVLRALDILIDHYGEQTQYLTQREDLETFAV